MEIREYVPGEWAAGIPTAEGLLNAGGDWSLQKTVTVTHSAWDVTGDSTVKDKHLYSWVSW